MKNGKILGVNGLEIIFEEDPYVYEETLLETENQVKRFMELMGRKPDYFHPHSLMTNNTERCAIEIAKKYGILRSVDVMKSANIYSIPCDWTPKPFPLADQMNTDVENNFLKALSLSLDHKIGYFICHCGHVDADLLSETTYTLIRTKDLACALSDNVKKFLSDNNIELVTYSDIKGDL